MLGEEHPGPIVSLSSDAHVADALRRSAEAEPLARRCVEMAVTDRSLEPYHPWTRGFAGVQFINSERLERTEEAHGGAENYARFLTRVPPINQRPRVANDHFLGLRANGFSMAARVADGTPGPTRFE